MIIKVGSWVGFVGDIVGAEGCRVGLRVGLEGAREGEVVGRNEGDLLGREVGPVGE